MVMILGFASEGLALNSARDLGGTSSRSIQEVSHLKINSNSSLPFFRTYGL